MLATLALRLPFECLKRGLVAHHVKPIRQPSSSGSLPLLKYSQSTLSACPGSQSALYTKVMVRVLPDESPIDSLHHHTAEAILCGPGQLHELETRLVDGRIQRVYKNLWPSLRDFWLWVAQEYKHKTYVVFEKDRISYGTAFERSVKAASVFRHVYGVKKGDRVVICSRNIPDYLVALWACQLIGAVSVFVNAYVRAYFVSYPF